MGGAQLGEDLPVSAHHRDERARRRGVRPQPVGVGEEIAFQRRPRQTQLGGERRIGGLHDDRRLAGDPGGVEDLGHVDQVLPLGDDDRDQLVGRPLDQRLEDLTGRRRRQDLVAAGLEPARHATLPGVQAKDGRVADEPRLGQAIGDVAGACAVRDLDLHLALGGAAGPVAVVPGDADDDRQRGHPQRGGDGEDDQGTLLGGLHYTSHARLVAFCRPSCRRSGAACPASGAR